MPPSHCGLERQVETQRGAENGSGMSRIVCGEAWFGVHLSGPTICSRASRDAIFVSLKEKIRSPARRQHSPAGSSRIAQNLPQIRCPGRGLPLKCGKGGGCRVR